MKEKILKLLQDYGDVTFVELAQEIEGFSGNLQFFNNALDNVILWDGVSEDALDALKALISSRKITVQTTSAMTYLDVGFMGFPGFKTIDVEKSAKEPAWLPVVLCRGRD